MEDRSTPPTAETNIQPSDRTQEKTIMPRVVHFEFAAEQPDRAEKFYNEVFGWSATKWDGPMDYRLLKTGEEGTPGINGALFVPCDGQGLGKTVATIDVPSVDEYIAKITDHGGSVANPKMAVPGVGYVAHCKDTEGTLFGIIQFDHSVK